jgi:hypothetical protein
MRAKESGYRQDAAEAAVVLGLIRLHVGRHADALQYFEEGCDVARKCGHRLAEIAALTGMALAAGRSEFAVQAMDLARERRMRLLGAKAEIALAKLMHDSGDTAEALSHAESALAVMRASGAEPAVARALSLLGDLLSRGSAG